MSTPGMRSWHPDRIARHVVEETDTRAPPEQVSGDRVEQAGPAPKPPQPG